MKQILIADDDGFKLGNALSYLETAMDPEDQEADWRWGQLEKMELRHVHLLEPEQYEDLRKMIASSPPDILITDQDFGSFCPTGTALIRWIREDKGMDFPIILHTTNAFECLEEKWGVKVTSCAELLPSLVGNLLRDL